MLLFFLNLIFWGFNSAHTVPVKNAYAAAAIRIIIINIEIDLDDTKTSNETLKTTKTVRTKNPR